MIVQIVRIVNYALPSDSEKPQSNLISSILYILTSLTIIWLMNYDRRKGMFCSGLLFGFWLLVCVAIIPDVIDYTIEYKRVNHLDRAKHFDYLLNKFDRKNRFNFLKKCYVFGFISLVDWAHLSSIALQKNIHFLN